jgi:hypothetical protein
MFDLSQSPQQAEQGKPTKGVPNSFQRAPQGYNRHLQIEVRERNGPLGEACTSVCKAGSR